MLRSSLRPHLIHRQLRLIPRVRHTAPTRDSSTTPSSSLLARIRNDLKVAMRSKDTARLAVIRALLSDITNSSKGESPITTDIQVLAAIRKRISSGEMAAEQFRDGGREDLVKKEEGEVAVLKDYAGTVQKVAIEDIKAAVERTLESLRESGEKLNLGLVLKKVMDEGELKGKPVEKKEVVEAIKSALA